MRQTSGGGGEAAADSSLLMSDYRRWLFQVLAEKKRRNPKFSLRALAGFVGVSVTTLSQVLSGKRPLTERAALKIANRLGISSYEKDELLKRVSAEERSASEVRDRNRRELENDVFRTISDWYCYAILELCHLPNHRTEPDWISSRLGVPVIQVVDALQRLQRLGLLKIEDGRLRQTSSPLTTSGNDVTPNRSIQKFHRQMMVKASRALEDVHPSERPVSTIFLTLALEDLDVARNSMKVFRRQLVERLQSNPKRDRTYALQMHLFPVDRPQGKDTP